MLWKCYIPGRIRNSLFNSALPDGRLHCHVAYSNISWVKISELGQMDGFAGGCLRMIDTIAIVIITTIIIYSSGDLATTISGAGCDGVQFKAASPRRDLHKPQGAAAWGKGTEVAADLMLSSCLDNCFSWQGSGGKRPAASAGNSFSWKKYLCVSVSGAVGQCIVSLMLRLCDMLPVSGDHRITESQNGRGWKGPLWVI